MKIPVTDANLNPCAFDTVIVFNNPSQLTLSTSQTDVSCFGENDGEIVYTASGGFQPYTLVFEDGTQNENDLFVEVEGKKYSLYFEKKPIHDPESRLMRS